uniref:Selenoprotein W n=1 Tax=Astyanax mexicanus TaxID=7994 RepID=A0A8B9K0A5_ASTMX
MCNTTLKKRNNGVHCKGCRSGESTPRTSGWFEVEVNGKLVHSKKNGDGFVDSDQKMAKIVSAIEKSIGK